MLAYAQGDEAAFRAIFQRYAPLLVRVMCRRVGRPSDAQDLTQQTFLHLHRARKDFRAEMRLRPWIMTIAMNLARDLLRRRGRRPETSIEQTSIAAILSVDPVDPPTDEAAHRVRGAVAALPREQREVIELHWFGELPFNDIAAVVGASPGAVRVRAHRGYVALRKTLKTEDVPEELGPS